MVSPNGIVVKVLHSLQFMGTVGREPQAPHLWTQAGAQVVREEVFRERRPPSAFWVVMEEMHTVCKEGP